jgi:NADH:ubiquinone reductase (non-electrogenic)
MELEVSYDKLVIAVGAQPNTFGIPGVKENALFLKEAEDSAKLHAKLLCNLEKAAALMRHGGKGDQYEQEIDRLLKVFVVGGGPTGVELSAELADFAHNDVAMRYGKDVSDRIRIVLVEAMPRILAPFDESLANVAKDHLQSRGVDVRTGVAITSVGDGEATFAPSTPRNATPEEKSKALAQATTEESGVLVWAAGIESRPLVKKLAKALGQTDTRGLKVDSSLRVEGADGVYAIGDAALSGFAPTAQVAAQQGKHIGRSIRDATDSPFAYKHAGSLCCLGQGNGIAQLLVPSESASFNVWEAIGAQAVGPNGDERAITGTPAFILWRSLYWTKLMSTSSRLSLTVDWIKSLLSGRDVVEPVLQSRPTIGSGAMASVETFGSSLQRNSTVKFVEEKAKEVAQKRRFWIL